MPTMIEQKERRPGSPSEFPRRRFTLSVIVAIATCLSPSGSLNAAGVRTASPSEGPAGADRIIAGEAVAGCTDLRFSEIAAMPLDIVQVTGLPANFGELLAAEVTPLGGGNTSITYVERQENGHALFHTPLHPNGRLEGGEVSVRIIDGEGRKCQSTRFQIRALRSAPGKFKEYIKLVQEAVRLQAEAVGTTPDELRNTPADALAPEHVPVGLAQDLLDGSANPNSLADILEGRAPQFEDAGSSEWELLDALLDRSGVVDSLREHVEELQSASSDLAAGGDGIDSGAAAGSGRSPLDRPAHCQSSFYEPDAATLDKMMRLAMISDIATSGKAARYIDAAGLALSAGVVLATAAGPGGRQLAAGYTGAALAVFAHQKSMEAMDGLLPSKLMSLEFDYSPARFHEDDPRDGTWANTMLMARSKGWNADKAVLEALLQVSGLNAAGGFAKTKWFRKFLPEGAATELADGFQSLIMQTAVGKIIQEAAGSSDFLRIPPCDFGPTDISDEKWSEGLIPDSDHAPARITGHGQFRIHDTGEIFLRVRSREQRFGFVPMGKTEVIVVSPITVVVDPGNALVEPGDVKTFSATVANANNTDLEWTVTPEGAHRIAIDSGAGTSRVQVITSGDSGDFPAVVRARSTATLGLRALEDRPERFNDATIREKTLRIESLEGEAHGLLGEKLTFTAVVRAPQGARVTYTWDFGDGRGRHSGLDAASAGHAYDGTGIFKLSLEVRDSVSGGSDQAERQVQVHRGLAYTVRGAARLDIDTKPHGLGGVTGWLEVPAGGCMVRFWSSGAGSQHYLTFAGFLRGGLHQGTYGVHPGRGLEWGTEEQQKRVGRFYSSLDFRESPDHHSERWGFGAESGVITITSFAANRVAGNFDIQMNREVVIEPSLETRMEYVDVKGVFVVFVQNKSPGMPYTYYNCKTPVY